MAESLNAALLEAQRNVGEVEKDSRNEFGGFNYASAEAIISAARNALLDAGLIAYRETWRFGEAIDPQTSNLRMFFCLTHADSGESARFEVQWPAIPGKGRPLDKAVAAALTSGWSYWLRDLLLIPRVEESMDDRDDSQYTPPEPASEDQIGKINALIESTGTNSEQLANYYKVGSIDQLNREQAQSAITLLQRKRDEAQSQEGSDG